MPSCQKCPVLNARWGRNQWKETGIFKVTHCKTCKPPDFINSNKLPPWGSLEGLKRLRLLGKTHGFPSEIYKFYNEDEGEKNYLETIKNVNSFLTLYCPEHNVVFSTNLNHHVNREDFGCKQCKLAEVLIRPSNRLDCEGKCGTDGCSYSSYNSTILLYISLNY